MKKEKTQAITTDTKFRSMLLIANPWNETNDKKLEVEINTFESEDDKDLLIAQYMFQVEDDAKDNIGFDINGKTLLDVYTGDVFECRINQEYNQKGYLHDTFSYFGVEYKFRKIDSFKSKEMFLTNYWELNTDSTKYNEQNKFQPVYAYPSIDKHASIGLKDGYYKSNIKNISIQVLNHRITSILENNDKPEKFYLKEILDKLSYLEKEINKLKNL